MPAFVFGGSGDTNDGLHRVYIFSDRDCVNIVYRGAVVGGPAYAPRTSGPLALPQTVDDLARRRRSSCVGRRRAAPIRERDTTRVRTTEALPPSTASTPATTTAQGRPLGSQLARRPLLLDGRPGASPDRRPAASRLSGNRAPAGARSDARVLAFGKRSVQAAPVPACHRPVAQRAAPSSGVTPTAALRASARRRGQPRPRPPSTTSSGAGDEADRPWQPAGHIRRPRRRRRCSPVTAALGGIASAASTRRFPATEDDLVRTRCGPDRQADLQGHRGLGGALRRLAKTRGRLRPRRAADRDDRHGRSRSWRIVAGSARGWSRSIARAAHRRPARSPTSRWRAYRKGGVCLDRADLRRRGRHGRPTASRRVLARARRTDLVGSIRAVAFDCAVGTLGGTAPSSPTCTRAGLLQPVKRVTVVVYDPDAPGSSCSARARPSTPRTG